MEVTDSAPEAAVAPGRPAAVIVQQGKILDFIDGITQRKETPEEYVRQEIAKSLVREYGYYKGELSVEFTLKLGSRRPRADLVIFNAGDDQPFPLDSRVRAYTGVIEHGAGCYS